MEYEDDSEEQEIQVAEMSEKDSMKEKSLKAEIDKDIELLFKKEFKDLSITNVDNFYDKVWIQISSLDKFVEENENEAIQIKKEKDDNIKLMKKQDLPPGPDTYALQNAEEMIKRMHFANVYKSYIMKMMNLALKKMMDVVREVKDVNVDKMRIEASKTLYGDLFEKRDKMILQLNEEIGKLRDYNYKLLTIVDKINDKMNLKHETASSSSSEQVKSYPPELFEKQKSPETKPSSKKSNTEEELKKIDEEKDNRMEEDI